MPGFTWFCPCPIPPISPCLKKYTPHSRRETKIVIHSSTKYEKVVGSFESLDYEKFQNELTNDEEKQSGIAIHLLLAFQRNIVIAIVAILTGLCVTIIDLSEHHVLKYKFAFLETQIHNYFGKPNMHIVVFIYWILLTLIPAMIGSLLVVFIQPVAAGGGLPGIIGFLNGIRVPRIIKVEVLIVKLISTSLMLISNIPSGKEGPLIHMGVILGGSVPMIHIPFTNIRFFRLLQNDRERRDMASVGIAAGLAAAFRTPIGGFILALEEGVTYCSAQLAARIFLGSLLSSSCSAFFISSLIHGCFGCVLNKDLLLLAVNDSAKYLDYQIYEVPMFILIGIIGGITGSLWNSLEIQISYLRQRYFKKKLYKLLEMGMLTTLTAALCFTMMFSLNDCRKADSAHEKVYTKYLQMHCSKGEYPTPALFFFQTDPEFMSSLISEEKSIGLSPLCIYLILYFTLSAAFMGASISGGVFVPNLITGAIWGRLLSEFILKVFPETKDWCYPQKYAFLAAGAHIAGATRICFSLGIILLESSGNISFGLPIFLVVITTKFVADMFTHPVYHAECLMKGMPLLEKTPPPYCSWIPVRNIMNRKVVALPLITTVENIMNILSNNKHNGYPVVNPSRTSTEDGVQSYGQLLGSMLRENLMIILKNKLYKVGKHKESLYVLRNQFDTIRTDTPPKYIQSAQEEEKEQVDLGPFMHLSPVFVQMGASFTSVYALMAALGLRHVFVVNNSNEGTSFTRVYALMTGLGMRHLLVVNNTNEVVGIVTRKDIAVHKSEITCCTVESKVVPPVEN